VEWLQEIPSHWSAQKLRNLGAFSASGIDKKIVPGEPLVDIVNYTDVYGNKTGLIEGDRELMRVSCPESKLKEHQIQKGDLLFTPSSETIEDIGVSCLVNADRKNTSFSYHLIRLKFAKELAHGFKKYLCNNEYVLNQFSQAARGTTRQTLGRDDFKATIIPLPPLPEQTQIAKFLDHETAKIDRLIEKQEALIRLLKEKRQAVISHAVTKGLNPHALLKDSGIDWLGQVPAHWTPKRLKHISPKIGVGLVINPSTYTKEEGLYFIFGGDVREYGFDLATTRKISKRDSDRLPQSRLSHKDLVSVRVGNPGITAVVPEYLEGANCASLVVIRSGGFDSEWLCSAMNSWVGRQQVDLTAYGAAQKQFNISDAVDFVFPVPPAEEQREIADFVARTRQRFDALSRSAETQIALLQERRTALISAAVTGKIDVRHWQPPAEQGT
jgi:type I restriction enzyme S subunit